MVSFKNLKAEKLIFASLLFCALFTIWFPQYLVQGDGPAHIYNSKILLDLARGVNTQFYTSYYDFVFSLVPNWFTHLWLALLQTLFAPVIAEKVFVSVYALFATLSFRFLCRQLNPKTSYSYFLVFPLVFQFLYYYGFYNYCFGMALGLLFVGCWLKWQTGSVYKSYIGLLSLSALVFFTHPLGWFLIAAIMAGFALIDAVQFVDERFSKIILQKLMHRWLPVVAAALVPLILSLLFIKKHSGDDLPKRESMERLWEALASFEVINIYSGAEDLIAPLFSWLLLGAIVLSVAFRLKNKTGFKRADSFLIGVSILLIVYFIQPPSLTLASFWVQRMSWLPWLLLILWLSAVEQPEWLNKALGATGAIIFIALLIVRLPFQLKNSEAEQDYLSAIPYIPANAVVLPLSFCNFGCDETGQVYNKTWFFQHGFDYSGAIKSNINLVNYQAQTPWFPVQYRHGCDPYVLLNCTECQPPNVLLDGFEKNGCSWKIEYVITFCIRYRDSKNELNISLNKQLDKGYDMIYESVSGRTQLWRLKTISNSR
jgi:hypothetical protein